MSEAENWVEMGKVLNKLIDKKYACAINSRLKRWTIIYNKRKICHIYHTEECTIGWEYSMINKPVQIKYDDPEYVDKLNGFIKTLE